VQAIAKWLRMRGATEVLIAIGAVGAHGDMKLAGVGCEVPDLSARD
jgi:hypothetical protein